MKITGIFQAGVILAVAGHLPTLAGDDHNFYARIAPTTLFLSEGADIEAGGARIPGGTISVGTHTTGTVEFGYYFTPNFSVGFTGGFPPSVGINGAGTLAGVGKLGSITYGPTALTAQYTFTDFGRIKPYIGAGPMFMIVFDEDDAALKGLNVKGAVGAVVQAGVDLEVTDRWGLFADVKKGYLRTTATGTLGGTPVAADVKLDPLAVSMGIKFRF